MRISDWSSDVCSSDLGYSGLPLQRRRPMAGTRFATHEVGNQSPSFQDLNLFLTYTALQQAVRRDGSAASHEALAAFGAAAGSAEAFELVRKIVVWGWSVSARADLGGRRNINEKKHK